ncbi:putative lipid kinase [Alistipes sp. cv1]|nr:putative lipid kinase [Faecalibacterium prausnitzii]
MCAICNGRTYGGGFCAAPEAQPDDGWLDVYIIRKVSRVTIAKLLGMYKSGKHFQNGQLVRAAEPYFIYRRANLQEESCLFFAVRLIFSSVINS